MEVQELKLGIADMRRHFLIAELMELKNDSPNDFDSVRAEIAAMALHTKDRKDLENTIRSLVKELEQSKAATE